MKRRYIGCILLLLSVACSVGANVPQACSVSAAGNQEEHAVAVRNTPERPAVTPKDTVDYTFPEAELTISATAFQLQTPDTKEVFFYTSISSKGRIAGTYTEYDVTPWGISLRVGNAWIDAIRYDLTITQTDYVYYAKAELFGKNDTLYRIDLTSRTLAPTSVVDITIQNMATEDITAMQGFFEVKGSEAQYSVLVRVEADEMADGDYEENISATITTTDGMVTSRLAKLALDKQTAYVEILGSNSVLYRVRMSKGQVQTSIDTVKAELAQPVKRIEQGRFVIYDGDREWDASGECIQ